MRRLADRIGRCIDLFHVGPVAAIVPRQTFRYAACGAMTLGLDACWYALFYHLVFRASNFDLGFVVVSPHVAALVLVFPITFFTGSTAKWLSAASPCRRARSSSATRCRSWARSC